MEPGHLCGDDKVKVEGKEDATFSLTLSGQTAGAAGIAMK